MDNPAQLERDAIVAWLDECRAVHEENAHKKGQIIARKHHIDACKHIAAAIARGEHHAVRHG